MAQQSGNLFDKQFAVLRPVQELSVRWHSSQATYPTSSLQSSCLPTLPQCQCMISSAPLPASLQAAVHLMVSTDSKAEYMSTMAPSWLTNC